MDFAQTMTKDFSEFCVQLNDMRVKFLKWDHCEKTVALYYLMTGLPFANARFLQYALEQRISEVDTIEAKVQERNANDIHYVKKLLTEHPQLTLSLLLSHLPLLRPGNKEIADCYLATIRQVLSEFFNPPSKIFNECVELMSYVFIHPAFNKDDKKTFKHLLKQVMSRVSPDTFIHSPVNESSDESVSPNPDNIHLNVRDANIRLNRRSNSLTPAQTSSHESLVPGQELWSSQENLSQPLQKPRSYSLSNDKSLQVNLGSLIQSSSSETRLQDLQTLNNLPVMKSITSWLKSLRLHKYSWVFNNLTFEQMLNLDEGTLQSIGITKGARHKLLLSLAKLRERSAMLTDLEVEVMNGGNLSNALKKLKSVIQTPLQITEGEDLASQFVKVMGKVCTQLLMMRQPSDECFVLFAHLCERAEVSEAFTDEQKRRLSMWKGQLIRVNPNPVYNQQRPHNGHFRSPAMHGHYQTYMTNHLVPPSYTQKSSSYPNVQGNAIVNGHRHSIGSLTLPKQLNAAPSNPYSFKSDLRTNYKYSNNTTPNPFHVRFQEADIEDKNKQISKIESSLESLCLQMMEHALGP